MENKQFHAFYSAEADRLYGHAIYSFYSTFSRQQETVKVTGVYGSKEDGEQNYKWKDKVYLGIVDRWISSHNKKLDGDIKFKSYETKRIY